MRVLIAAGGTAGHINPALAIAGAIKGRPVRRDTLCRPEGGDGIPSRDPGGLPFHHIEITGFQRRLS